MFAQNIAIALAITGAFASPLLKRDACSDACSAAYNTCRGKPDANRSTCASEYSSCLGYLPFNDSGSLVTPTACSSTTAPTPTVTSTSDPKECAEKCSASYNTCRGKPDANRATCAAEYSSCLGYLPFNDSGSLVTPTACSSTSTTAAPTATITQAPAVTAAPAPATNAGWTVKNLSRYCAEDGTGCDYNFKISTNDGTPDESCTVIRIDVKDAPTESWYDQPCTTGSDNKVSWGYSTQFETPFAVLTVVNQNKKSVAYFGVNNVNGEPVTPSNPKGSGNFGDIGPQPVYAF